MNELIDRRRRGERHRRILLNATERGQPLAGEIDDALLLSAARLRAGAEKLP